MEELDRFIEDVSNEDSEEKKGETDFPADEYTEDDLEFAKKKRDKLKAETELYCQEVYELRRKLELQDELLKELQEANESLERANEIHRLEKEKTLHDTEEKYRARREQYEKQITICESHLKQKENENEELRAELKHCEQIAVALAQEPSTICHDDIQVLEKDLKELSEALQEATEKRQQAEAMLEQLKCQHAELQTVTTVMREQIAEKTEVLENAKEELALLRTELNKPKPCPDGDLGKGNSLFAEVEDRRKDIVDKYAFLKQKLTEAERIATTEMNENKLLWKECVAMLRKLETDCAKNTTGSPRLMKDYKIKISQLENELQAEIRKNSSSEEKQPDNSSYEYFQSLLTKMRKQIEGLEIEVRNLLIHVRIQEDAKQSLTTEMEHYKSKALSMEAAASAVKTHIKSEINNVDKEIRNNKTLENEEVNIEPTVNIADIKKHTKHNKVVSFAGTTTHNFHSSPKAKSQKTHPIMYIPE